MRLCVFCITLTRFSVLCCLYVNLKFVKCKQRKPHVCKIIPHTYTPAHKRSAAFVCAFVCHWLILYVHWKLRIHRVWVELNWTKGCHFQTNGGWFWQFYFFVNSVFCSCFCVCVMTEINIEFMRFNTTNNTAQWVKLIITSYYVFTLFGMEPLVSFPFSHSTHTATKKCERSINITNSDVGFCRLFSFASLFLLLENKHIVSRALIFFSWFIWHRENSARATWRQREEMKTSRYGWTH